jgi:hypothetical protein
VPTIRQNCVIDCVRTWCNWIPSLSNTHHQPSQDTCQPEPIQLEQSNRYNRIKHGAANYSPADVYCSQCPHVAMNFPSRSTLVLCDSDDKTLILRPVLSSYLPVPVSRTGLRVSQSLPVGYHCSHGLFPLLCVSYSFSAPCSHVFHPQFCRLHHYHGRSGWPASPCHLGFSLCDPAADVSVTPFLL